MSNEFIMLLEIVVVFSIVLLSHKFFGENGLMAWMAVASCIAQIGAAKTVSILGMGTSAGSVLFASTFLVTDILAECYGRKAAKKAVLFICQTVVKRHLAQHGAGFGRSDGDSEPVSRQRRKT